MPKTSSAVPDFSIPDDTQIRLNAALYAESATLVVGAAMTMIVGTFFWIITGAATPLVVAIATPALTIIRVLLVGRNVNGLSRWRELAFVVCTSVYLVAIGVLTLWGLFESSSVVVVAIVVALHMLNVMGIALRFFAVRRVVVVNLAAMFAPLMAGFFWRGGPYLAAAIVCVMLAIFVYNSAERLRAILRSEIIHHRRSETVASRFRFAIDNMSHGVCMVCGGLAGGF